MTAVLISGVVYGVFYVLMAMGIAVVDRYGSALNFAQGAIATLAAYLMYSALGHGIPYWGSACLAIAGGALSSMLMGAALIKWFTHATHLTRTMATLGPSLALVGAVGILWGQDAHAIPAPPGMGKPLMIGGHAIDSLAVAGLALLLIFVVGFGAMLRFTRVGLALRSMSDDIVVAQSYGIQVNRLQVFIWAIAGVLAAVSALIITPANQLDPQFLTNFLILSFTAVVLGGVGSIPGLLAGGLIFGLLIALAQYYFDGEVTGLASLAILLVVLAVRPAGLFSALRSHLSSTSGLGHLAAGAGRSRLKARRDLKREGVRSRPRATTRLGSASRDLSTMLSQRLGVRIVAALVFVILAAFLLPAILPEPTLYAVATAVAMVVAVSGQNIASGLSGQLSLAQGGIMLVASYVAALGATRNGMSPLVAMLFATVVCAVLGVVLSAAASRVSGVYLAVVTMSFSIAGPELARNLSHITNGDIGIITDPLSFAGQDFIAPRDLFIASLVLGTIALGVLYALSRSRFGKLWRAVRDSADAAKASGVALHWPRMGAFAVSSAAGGFAGSLMTFQTGIVTPDSFTIFTSINILLAAALGGEESVVVGPIIGASLIVLLPHLLSGQGSLASVIFGVAMFLFLALRSRIGHGKLTLDSAPTPEPAQTDLAPATV